MKPRIFMVAALILCASLFPVLNLHAQPLNPLGTGSLMERAKAFFADLKLTEDQQDRVREVYMAEAEKLAPLFLDQSLSREDKARKFQEWVDQLDPKLQPILTPEQFQKYKEKKGEWQKAGQGRRQPLDRIKTALQCSDEEWTAIKPLVEDVTTKQRERMSLSGVREIQALQQSVIKPGVPAGEIQRGMEAVRAYQREKDAALKSARDRLRQVLSSRQEAVLLLYGILD